MVPREVLIIEDEPKLRATYAEMAEAVGFACRSVGSAESAWRMFAARPAPVVVLDLNLPGESGMALFRRIRAAGGATQVVIVTAFGGLGDAQEAIDLGVVAFLSKPCHLGEFERAFVLAHRRACELNDAADRDEKPALRAVIHDDQKNEPAGVQPLDELERRHIEAALVQCRGNRRAAAAALGISERKLYYRIRQYGWAHRGWPDHSPSAP